MFNCNKIQDRIYVSLIRLMGRLFGRAVHNSALCCLHRVPKVLELLHLANEKGILFTSALSLLWTQISSFIFIFFCLIWNCVKCNTSYRMHDNFKLNADNLSPCCPRATNLIRDCNAGINREVKYPFREISLKKIKSTSGKKKITYTSLFFQWLQKEFRMTRRVGHAYS